MARKRTALDIAHQIADDLSAKGLHGTFTVREEVFAGIVYHEFRAVLNKRSSLSIDQVDVLGPSFRRHLEPHYSGRTFIRFNATVENDDGEAVPGQWRALGRVRGTRAAFNQMPGRVASLSVEGVQSATYLDVRGLSVHVEAGKADDQD